MTSQSSAIGLDVGTSRIVAARRSECEFEFDSQLNAFVTIPFSRMTQAVLEREKIPHTALLGNIIVTGNEREKFASLLNDEMRRPMTRGVLDAKEPESLRMIQAILSSILE